MLPLLVLALSIVAGPMVSANWLEDHLNDPQVRVIHVGDTADYARGHIPGARLVDHMELIRRGDRLAPPDELVRIFVRAGVSDGARIVLYGRSPMETGYVYSALAAIGFADDVSWLDGGISGWSARNHPIETTTPDAGKGPLSLRPASDLVVDSSWVRGHLNSPTTRILDVRSPKEFEDGHLPGATLIHWQDLFSDSQKQTLKSPEEIRALLTRAGVGPNQDVVTYCTMGMRASVMVWAARVAGVKAHVYLGSWEDWSSDRANPIVH